MMETIVIGIVQKREKNNMSVNFTEIDVNTYSGNVPTGTDLVVAESGDVEETALVLYGFDEIGMFDDEFNNPVYGFLGDK